MFHFFLVSLVYIQKTWVLILFRSSPNGYGNANPLTLTNTLYVKNTLCFVWLKLGQHCYEQQDFLLKLQQEVCGLHHSPEQYVYPNCKL